MIWLLLLSFSVLSSVLVYSRRYIEKTGLKGKTFVQYYYMVIGILSCISIFGILREISEQIDDSIISQTPFVILLLTISTALCVVGTLLHSVSLLVQQRPSFRNNSTWKKNIVEFIHLPFSHYMVYIGGIFSLLSIGYLDLL